MVPFFFHVIVVVLALLFCLSVYALIQCCFLLASALCAFHHGSDENWFKKHRIMWWQNIFFFNKVASCIIFIAFFYGSLTKLNGIGLKLMLLCTGSMWFGDMFLWNFLQGVKEPIDQLSGDDGMGAVTSRRIPLWRRFMCFGGAAPAIRERTEDDERRRDVFGLVGRCPFWRHPTEHQMKGLETIMSKQRFTFCHTFRRLPFVNRFRFSIEHYMFMFTSAHLVVVLWNGIGNYVHEGNYDDAALDRFQTYMMFPLGVFFGEKAMVVVTGFAPWYIEYTLSLEYRGSHMIATIGLLINVLDFIMVFFSIVDDCLGLSSEVFPCVATSIYFSVVMGFIDGLFDLFAIGSGCCNNDNDETDSDSEYQSLPK